jgi:alkylation response protein AidB-like acyl-CoA dehydrogenase
MRFTFTEEQREFQRAVRDFLDKECPPSHVRAMTADESGRSQTLWKGLADLGVVGMTVPEEHGGLEMNEIDMVLVLHEAGRAALPEPLVETTAVSVPLLRDIGGPVAAEWLPRIASGDAVVTAWGLEDVGLTDAHVASLVLMRRGDGIAAVPASELRLTAHPSVDATRRLFTYEDSTDDPPELLISGAAATRALDAAFDRGALATAAVLCGIADRSIEMAASYARERHQFGKPIGSFQAVKHLLADALLGLEFARPLVYRAAWSIANDVPERSRDVSMAKAATSDAAVGACRSALQVHGAIGYTHEHDLHLWLNKGTALAGAWGTASWHRERVARSLLG